MNSNNVFSNNAHEFNTSSDDDSTQYYRELGNRIGTLFYSIIYLFGYTGNSLAILTFSSRRMRQISSSVFLLAISIIDTVALITSIWFFLADAFNIHLQNYSALACRLRTFLAYLFMDLSSWCIAGLSIDRYLRTAKPITSKTMCTPRNVVKVILIFTLILSLINGHYLSPGIGQEPEGNRTMAHCLENRDEYPNYFYFLKIIWPKIDIIVFCFLPATIMIICNVKIIIIVKENRHNLEDVTTRSLRRKSIGGQRKALERQMSLMMLACVIAFLITTVPVTISLAVLENVITKYPDLPRQHGSVLLIFRLLRSWMYTHFGSNFYLYCLTSRIFRAEFIKTITCTQSNSLNHHESQRFSVLRKISEL